jgi:hypothetical protein
MDMSSCSSGPSFANIHTSMRANHLWPLSNHSKYQDYSHLLFSRVRTHEAVDFLVRIVAATRMTIGPIEASSSTDPSISCLKTPRSRLLIVQ